MPTNLFDFGAVKSARLSRMTDAELAAEVGVPADWVPLVRAGIAAKWPPERLERLKCETIASLASAWGMSMATILQMRQAMGVRGFRGSVQHRIDVRCWTPGIEARLGKVPDRVIAAELGVTATYVLTHRRHLGIPATRKRTVLEWTPELLARLGHEPDRTIAAELGCTKAAVAFHRKRLGLPSHQSSKWTPDVLARLGKDPDAAIAAALGVVPMTVSKHREELGLPAPALPDRPTRWTPEIVARLGKEPDAAIEASLGMPRTVVNLHRRRLGIPAFKPKYIPVDRLVHMSALWADGQTIEEIAQAMGRNAHTIQHHIKRHPDLFPPRPKPMRIRNPDVAVRRMMSFLAESA